MQMSISNKHLTALPLDKANNELFTKWLLTVLESRSCGRIHEKYNTHSISIQIDSNTTLHQ